MTIQVVHCTMVYYRIGIDHCSQTRIEERHNPSISIVCNFTIVNRILSLNIKTLIRIKRQSSLCLKCKLKFSKFSLTIYLLKVILSEYNIYFWYLYLSYELFDQDINCEGIDWMVTTLLQITIPIHSLYWFKVQGIYIS